MEYYLVMKKNKIMPFTPIWMELKTVTLSEVSHTEKDKYHMISLICGIFKKRGGGGTNDLIYKTEVESQM